MKPALFILLLLCVSLALAGCARKGAEGNATVQNAALSNGTPAAGNGTAQLPPPGSVPNASGSASGTSDRSLADLFRIDQDKPFGDAGLDTGTPSEK